MAPKPRHELAQATVNVGGCQATTDVQTCGDNGREGAGSSTALPDRHSTSRGLDLHVVRRGHDTERVGLNPFRQHRRSPADLLMVAAALLVCAALVAWAILG
jgi:hypothetical protein